MTLRLNSERSEEDIHFEDEDDSLVRFSVMKLGYFVSSVNSVSKEK